MTIRSTILTSLVAAACLLSVACISGRPIHYYTINNPPMAASDAKGSGVALLVGRIATPQALDDGRIRYRAGTNEVGSYEYQRWAERPGIMVQRLLLQTLRASGKYRQVQESSSTAVGDYLVRGKLNEFAEIDSPGIQSRVSLRVELVDRKTGQVVWDHSYNRDEPVAGKTMNDVVVSLDHNLQQAIMDVTSGIGAFLANRS